MRQPIVALALGVAIFAMQPASAETVSTADRSELQAAVVQYIDPQAMVGTFLHVSLSDGNVEAFDSRQSSSDDCAAVRQASFCVPISETKRVSRQTSISTSPGAERMS